MVALMVDRLDLHWAEQWVVRTVDLLVELSVGNLADPTADQSVDRMAAQRAPQ